MPDILFGWKKQNLLGFSCCSCCGQDYGRELAESQKREVALQAALDNSTEQMAELITALTELDAEIQIAKMILDMIL